MTQRFWILSVAAFLALAAPNPGLFGQSLLRNGAAESGLGGTGSAINFIPGWVPTSAQSPAVVQYTINPNSFPQAGSPGVVRPGRNFFAGGPSTANSSMQQIVNVAAGAVTIDQGLASYAIAVDLGGFASDGDNARLEVAFLGNAGFISSFTLGPVTPGDRSNLTGFVRRSSSGTIPPGTRSLRFNAIFTRTNGSYCDGYMDNAQFSMTPALPAPTPAAGICGDGTVGATPGYAALEVLTVNSQCGNQNREVFFSPGQNLGVGIASGYGNISTDFAVFGLIDQGTYGPGDLFPIPGVGIMCIPILSPDPRAVIVADSVGLGGLMSGTGTPWGTTFFGGIGMPFSLVIQGVLARPGGGYDLTNAIRVVIQ